MIKYYIFSILILLNFSCRSKNQAESSKISESKSVKSDSEFLEKKLKLDLENSYIKWIGKKITSSHDGIVNIKRGEILMEGSRVSSAEIVVDMNTIKNTDIQNEKSSNSLTSHLKNSDFFNVDSFPTALIIINNSEQISDTKYKFYGDLTIKGITNSVEFDGDIKKVDDKYSANIILIFDRTLWEIHYGSGKYFANLGDRMILDDIYLEISLLTK
tara:strand:+ start:455 stop:1099 length:645 start_codon:yes stop_codon:yes gene_type:complete